MARPVPKHTRKRVKRRLPILILRFDPFGIAGRNLLIGPTEHGALVGRGAAEA